MPNKTPDVLNYLPDNSGIKGQMGYLLDDEINLISLVGDELPMNTVTAARIMSCYNVCKGIPASKLAGVALVWDALNEDNGRFLDNPMGFLERARDCVKACIGMQKTDLINRKFVQCKCGFIFMIDPNNILYKTDPETVACPSCHGMNFSDLMKYNSISTKTEEDE